MKLSIEISYYPLNDNYKNSIKSFILALKENEKIVVQSNKISTQVFGDFDEVMHTFSNCVKRFFETPHSVFVAKFINSDLS